AVGGGSAMVRKDQELRPVMTRIPEGLRRRLEREAKFRGRSMNAEIVKRLQEAFDIVDQTSAIVEDVSSEVARAVGDAVFTLQKRLDGRLDNLESEIRAILARLEGREESKPDEAEPQQTKEEEEARKAEALQKALEAIERAYPGQIGRLAPKQVRPEEDGE